MSADSADPARPSGPLRVLHVVRPASGGMRRHVELLCCELATSGVSVAAAGPGDLDVGPGVCFPVSIAPGVNPLADLIAARRVARLAHGADLLHGHGLRGGFVAALAGRLSGVPVVFTAHNLAPARCGPLTRAGLRWLERRCGAVICVSRAVAESLERLGIPPPRMAVIPNGIDVGAYECEAAAPAHGIVAAIGRLAPEKGFGTLVQAASIVLLRHPGVRFILVGEGPERQALERVVAENHLGAAFSLAGYVDDVRDVLCQSAVVAVPSLSEGQGLVAVEAMAAGVPVVASAVGGLVETVVDRETGLLVPPGDAPALAHALIEVLGAPERRAAMGEAGRRRARELYTIQRMSRDTLSLYERVTGRPAR